MVSTPASHGGDLGSIPGPGMLYVRYKNLALNIRDLCIDSVSFGCGTKSHWSFLSGVYATQGVDV